MSLRPDLCFCSLCTSSETTPTATNVIDPLGSVSFSGFSCGAKQQLNPLLYLLSPVNTLHSSAVSVPS